MKILLTSAISSLLLLFSVSAYADKFVISGEPIVVEQQGEVYVIPPTAVAKSDYYFVTISDKKRVCYRTVQPSLANVDLGIATFKLGEESVQLHCYTYSPDYFMIP